MTSSSPTESVFQASAPALSEPVVLAFLRSVYGLAAPELAALPSERDQNLRVVDGDRRLVLKIFNLGADPAVVDMELAALVHLAEVDPTLPVPRLVASRDGATAATITGADGRGHLTRLITLLPGRPAEGEPVGIARAEAIGAAGARTSLALQGFFHPAAGRVLDWDVRRLPGLVGQVPQRVSAALAATTRLPAWVQHADVTVTTVLVGGSGQSTGDVTGVVDLGDLHHTAAVCDLAATLTSVLRSTSAEQPVDLWTRAAAVLRGYQRHRPLLPAEADVLGELVIARLLLALADSARRAPAHSGNAAHVTQDDASTRRVLAELEAVDPADLRARVRRMAGLGAPGLPGAGGLPADPAAAGADLLSRRRAVQAGGLSPLFYAEPLDIVRGEGVWLIARDGRRYLDGYNNVAVVGHSHPSVVQAITRQAALLHTHSRYLHPNVIELAERLVASMPPGSGLDTCLFTTSGTEANELAWRLATEYTSGTGAVIGSHAYHGSSKQLADLSSNEWPPGFRPANVATFPGPIEDPAALTHADATARIASATTDLRTSHGVRPAMVIADSMFTSEGVRPITPEFMTGLVDGAHDAGALYVADEVQIGFGRTGPQLWRFAALGATPDVVTLGKPMGAGYPIAAVLTRREIADTLAARYEFFSTFAGNPVGTAASLAVLDLLEDGAIGVHSLELGEYLRSRVEDLRAGHPMIGEVRGVGLIAGIDLPSRPAATAVTEELKARGVLVGSTGRHGDVLKVRPPLVWQREHVEVFVTALDHALGAVRTLTT
jgi:4-aminobutyrate aminotransferase-like enzyme/Ser/Thr protein kinase RdoA (MazF antagonist)